ncbi:MAG: hypothetical protein H7A18_00100 [Sinobacteraceae bacterium]|nr:hypothetical protein [Nevskiaceae bacterium]MCP5338655.1 hypothetical protein [Nevskiaceae bacterium]MCP5466666.1 hypothetical protein [Nevskiaceae bacterium]MCP5470466.1 hypothetical protein [Nevskiaceae bacterium]
MRITRTSLLVAGFAAALLAVGCANQKEPATKAIADVDAALSTLRDEASQYAATELQSVDSALDSLKANLEKGDYKAILSGAPALQGQVEALRQTVADKKAEVLEAARGQWATASSDLPKMVGAIQSRLDILTKSKKLPKGLDQATLDSAVANFDTMKSSWGEATTAATSGDFVEAMSKAESVRAKGAEVMAALGMKIGG